MHPEKITEIEKDIIDDIESELEESWECLDSNNEWSNLIKIKIVELSPARLHNP
jgi:hypothetical protein